MRWRVKNRSQRSRVYGSVSIWGSAFSWYCRYRPDYSSENKKCKRLESEKDFWAWLYNVDEYVVACEVENEAGVTMYEILATLYCPATEVERVQDYYKKIWYLENENSEARVEIQFTDEEKAFLNSMLSEETENSLEYDYDEELEYAYIVKESRDGVMEAMMYLVKKDDVWYWDTNVEDESKNVENGWATYVVELPDKLSEKVEGILYQ